MENAINPENQARTPEDIFPCRIFANATLGGSVQNAVFNLKIKDQLKIKFENSFTEVPKGKQIDDESDKEEIDPAVDKVRKFMKEFDYRMNNGNVYYKPKEGSDLKNIKF